MDSAKNEGNEEARRLRSLYDRYPIDRRQEIRLLRIHPGDWDDIVSCNLRTRDLWPAKSYAYSALSYVWGPEYPKIKTRIDNQEVLASSNLHAALRRLRAHNKDHFVTIFVDALCINQVDLKERNHQVTLMGSVYSRCAEVIFWLGELEQSKESSFRFDRTNVFPTKTSARHPADCLCKREQWLRSSGDISESCSSDMAVVAAPVLYRIANVRRCEDFATCHLFDTVGEIIAFRSLMHHIRNNVWFKRMWTVQEGILAERGGIYLGPVAVPIDVLFDLATTWEAHKIQGCCRSRMADLEPVVAPVVRVSYFLAKGRRHFREGHKGDLFAMRIEYPDRRASLDIDLLYGLLGLTDINYGILPDYAQSVQTVYTEASIRFLNTYPEYRSFWIFIYTPFKNRYKNMPSWAVDWTTLERFEYQNARYTWTSLLCEMELGPASDSLMISRSRCVIPDVTFSGHTMIIQAAHVDTISYVGRSIDSTDHLCWNERFYMTLSSWRAHILANHAPEDLYQPAAHRSQQIGFAEYRTWAVAWLQLLCNGFVPQLGDKWYKLYPQDIETILQEAIYDEQSPLLLRSSTSSSLAHGTLFVEHRALAGFSKLYQQVVDFIPQLLEGKRMFMTSGGYIGFGNANVRIGDEIYLPGYCMTPLILRKEAQTEKSLTGESQFTVVSAGYVQPFDDSLGAEISGGTTELHIV